MSSSNLHAGSRLIPIIVALPIFLQNLTGSVIATVLPTIAMSLHSDPLHLNLAITLYLLSLAVFLPLSGWLADRYGTLRVFCSAIVLFSVGSLCSAVSSTLWQLAAARVLQGMGGAVMLPVGRLILLRTVPKSDLVRAMTWFTIPPIVGSVAGPLLGGLIVTYFSWPWVFLFNLPFAVVAVVLAVLFIRDDSKVHSTPFDFRGYLMMAMALSGILFGLVTTGKGFFPLPATACLVSAGIFSALLYWRHTRSVEHPAVDFRLLRYATFRSAILGGALVRTGLGATPFLLPLMLQVGFGMTALAAGTLTFAWALGSLFTRPIINWSLHTFGFRRMLVGATLGSSLLYFVYGQFSPGMPHALIFGILMLGGAARGLLMTSMNTLGYSEIPATRMSHASVLASMAQQVSLTLGVAIAVLVLNFSLYLNGQDRLGPHDFWLTFTVVGLISASAIWFFAPLPHDAGAELTSRQISTRDRSQQRKPKGDST
jgi:EmrB/QacA subfamily drug resistance transporter